jgi:single-strand selective monofunctional uracil DNA glycosylase
MSISDALITAAKQLRTSVNRIDFSSPVQNVYNPLGYAWEPYEMYIRKYGNSKKKGIFLGINPGPFGMAQVGVPFGEIGMVKEWLGIYGKVNKPGKEHPKRPVEGFGCKRSEVSGRRLWGLFAERFGTADTFFRDYFVANYCPLIFFDEDGKNRTPDKLKKEERDTLYAACDKHLVRTVEAMDPKWIIGVGRFAESRAKEALAEQSSTIASIMHPSPSNPAANRGWAKQVTEKLIESGIWR